MKKLIVPIGYMGSGSSAITDLLSEFKDCSNEFGTFEYVFLHCPNGLFDLEDHLLIGNNAIKSDASLRIFRSQMKKLYDKPFWWVGNYKRVIGPKFMKITDDFVDNITQFNFKGFWYYHEEVNGKMFLKLLLRKPIKMISRNKLCSNKILRYNDGMKISFVTKDEFYKFAKKYVNEIVETISRGQDNVILDQLLLPYNLFRIDNYFDDRLRAIVVDRDPRDVFILNKYIWGKRKNNVPFPLEVHEFCKFYQKMRNSEHECKSDKIMRIHFEDLVYNYDNSVKKLAKFVGFSVKDHINPKTRFIPELSIKNTQIFNSDKKYNKEVKVIENELTKYLYSFPYKMNNKIEDTKDFDDWV